MDNILILLLAGESKRFQYRTKKQFVSINDKPLYCYSLDTFINIKKFNQIILVINKKDINTSNIKYLFDKYKKYFDKNIFKIVYGGKERYNSVYNALKYLNDNKLVNNRIMSDKKKQIFDGIWEQLEPEEKNVVVTEHLKTLPKWDLKRILCSVLGVDGYMNDEALRTECEKLIHTR